MRLPARRRRRSAGSGADADPAPPALRRERRDALVAEAGHVLWCFIVQREACGLRDSARVMRDYGVPGEVRLRMGIVPAGTKPPAISQR
jgi:hypothetical protein